LPLLILFPKKINLRHQFKVLLNKKALQHYAKGLEMVRLPQQNDFRTFCMSDETEKVYQELEEVISIC
jgi:hypothetical protein